MSREISTSSKRLYPLPRPGNAHEKAGALARELLAENKDPALTDRLKEIERLINGADDYLEETASDETPLQAKIGRDTYNEPWKENKAKGIVVGRYGSNGFGMASGYVEGQFLRIISQMTRAVRILEIGMFTGYGACSLADSVHCKEMVCMEIEPYFEEFLKLRIKGTPMENKLRVMMGSALDSLAQLKEEGKQFDLVFIDADKSNYVNYYKYIMDNGLLSTEGSILADNVLRDGSVFPVPSTETGQDIDNFNRFVMADERVNQMILPLRDGVMLIHRKDEYKFPAGLNGSK